mmetsp:Transcript_8587/g.31767  ORF Transcript_8587/g.31767 Transcript_8587/m.31767 type:complete len:94 (-) Transcript_8587:2207-2488(-)
MRICLHEVLHFVSLQKTMKLSVKLIMYTPHQKSQGDTNKQHNIHPVVPLVVGLLAPFLFCFRFRMAFISRRSLTHTLAAIFAFLNNSEYCSYT